MISEAANDCACVTNANELQHKVKL